ncbi:MAG TPA: TatD family hydrolase [Arenimonas sp.]|nr:TatD family hydrolase [Arenimonas sp.]
MRLIDSHCHLDVADFAADLPEALERGRVTGVAAFVVPAIDFASWPGLQALAASHPDIKPAFGLHPLFLADYLPAHLDALPGWLQLSECVAVGECGLDFFVPGLDVAMQEAVFIEHIRLAVRFDKPLIIHARKATERVIQLLKKHGPAKGVIHSYSGSLEQAHQLIAMGFYLGIAGPITYPRSQRIRAMVLDAPLDSLLLETDSPDQPLFGDQGRRNEPSCLPRVAQAIADAKGLPMAEVARQTTANAQRLFGFRLQ